MNEELKPCPFCGGEAEKEWGIPSIFWIKCTGCGVEGSQHGSLDDAIKAWNTRKPIDKVVEQLETELKLAEEAKEIASRTNIWQFESAKGYEVALANAIEIVKGGAE